MDAAMCDGDGAPDPELAGYFGPASMTWRVASEAALLLGGGRAVLMQLAHPLVAAGVGQHSSWSSDPWGRTFKTVELTQAIAFGRRSEARAAARVINRLHVGVTGALSTSAGSLPAGAPYRARDPALLLWVMATLVDTALLLYPTLVEPLTPAEQERYYREAMLAAALLGLPSDVAPPTLAAFRVYMREMLAGDALAVSPPARDVARVVMHMPAPLALRPLLLGAEQVTIGLLPPPLRELYGFSWDWRRQALLDAWVAGTRSLYRHLPPALRYVPAARAARRRVTAARAARCA
jgi:uncharacterized protein (DUF2236 family)